MNVIAIASRSGINLATSLRLADLSDADDLLLEDLPVGFLFSLWAHNGEAKYMASATIKKTFFIVDSLRLVVRRLHHFLVVVHLFIGQAFDSRKHPIWRVHERRLVNRFVELLDFYHVFILLVA